MKTLILILGAGGHAKVLIDCLLHQSNVTIIGILDNDTTCFDKEILGIGVLGAEDKLKDYSPNQVQLINGLGSIDIPTHRKNIFNKFKTLGYRFFSVIHPTACVANCSQLSEGVQILAGSIIQPGCKIGNNVIVNTRATIDHDCHIADHVHLAPAVAMSGNVVVGEESHIGTGAVIVQGITIEAKCLVAAGAVVIRNMATGQRVAGVPAKKIKEDISREELAKHFN